jgi:VWFA-related protein
MSAWALAALLAAPGRAIPQQAPPQQAPPKAQAPPVLQQEDPRARIISRVELVVVPVTAKDPSGRLVADLRQSEFRVFADRVEQTIAVFSADTFPLSAVVLIDNGLKLQTAETVQASLRAIAGGFSDQDEVAVCRFDTGFEKLSDFTSDNDRIFKALAQTESAGLNSNFPGQGSGPMTAGPRINSATAPGAPGVERSRVGGGATKFLDDAVYNAAQLLRDRARGRRKVIYIISDGINSHGNTNKYDDTLRLLLSSDISVYAVGVGEAVTNRVLSQLSRYAHQTGGDIYYASKRSDIEDLYAQVAEQARNQYTLAFIPEKLDPTIEYHSLEVRVRRANLTLLTRDGYYVNQKP